MKVFYTECFTGPGEYQIELTPNKAHSHVYSTVALQLEGTGNIALKGRLNDNVCSISAISMKDYSVVSTITAEGIYMVPAECLAALTLEVSALNGTLTARAQI